MPTLALFPCGHAAVLPDLLFGAPYLLLLPTVARSSASLVIPTVDPHQRSLEYGLCCCRPTTLACCCSDQVCSWQAAGGGRQVCGVPAQHMVN
jgi:hypothetical protein